ncbi:MAG: VWA domain-containing protein [Verrucomicrobiales bacterium]|nr:VWA domain-containing protein [Verrucomicrobiales bacterium]
MAGGWPALVRSGRATLTPRALLVWGGSVLLHALLVAGLCRVVVFSGVYPGGARGLAVRDAAFQPYEGRFGVEERGGQKLYQVSTRLAPAVAPVGRGTAIAAGTTGQSAGNTPERPRPTPAKAAVVKRVAGQNSFFGLRATGRVVVFVVDVSGSMYEKTGTATRMARVFHELEQTVWSLGAEQQFNIVLFATRAVPLAPAPLPATAEHQRRAAEFLAGEVDCGGTTNLGAGLALALTMRPDLLILLTDGEADSSPASIESQVELLRKRFCPAVRICAVGFYLAPDSAPERLLRSLSGSTHGEYVRLQKQP